MRREVPPRPLAGEATDDGPAEWAKPAIDAVEAIPDDWLATLDDGPDANFVR